MWRLGEDEERSFSVGPQPAAFACRLGGRHDHSVVTEAQAGALGLNGAESAEASIPGVRIWGPVPEAQAIGAGALAAASSVLIAPQHPPAELFHRLAALVPDDVLPRVSDTAHTLRLRLANSAFLHPITPSFTNASRH